MIIVLLGAPGSGKGTLANYLVNKYHFIALSTGNIFRTSIKNNDLYAKQIKSYLSSGSLVPDELTNNVLKSHLLTYDNNSVIILDGYPRTLNQAKFLDSFSKVNLVLNLVVDNEIIIKRLSGRLVCNNCNLNFNIYFNPPHESGVCDKCYSLLITRSDDKIEVINNRIKTYHDNNLPIITYYQKQNLIVDINTVDNHIDYNFLEFIIQKHFQV